MVIEHNDAMAEQKAELNRLTIKFLFPGSYKNNADNTPHWDGSERPESSRNATPLSKV